MRLSKAQCAVLVAMHAGEIARLREGVWYVGSARTQRATVRTLRSRGLIEFDRYRTLELTVELTERGREVAAAMRPEPPA